MTVERLKQGDVHTRNEPKGIYIHIYILIFMIEEYENLYAHKNLGA